MTIPGNKSSATIKELDERRGTATFFVLIWHGAFLFSRGDQDGVGRCRDEDSIDPMSWQQLWNLEESLASR